MQKPPNCLYLNTDIALCTCCQ